MGVVHGTRAELLEVLRAQQRFLERLVERAGRDGVSAAQLVDLVETLERLDDRRDELIGALREEASEARQRVEERSVRQFLLRALDELEYPQNASFLKEYVWGRERIDLDTRGLSALRRDELASWRRNSEARVAYVAPALDPNGRRVRGWLARSDWPAERRVVVLPDDERLLDLAKLRALFNARRERDPGDLSDPYAPMIETYAASLFEGQPAPLTDPDRHEAWLEEVRQLCDAEFEVESAAGATRRKRAAAQLSRLGHEEQIWGG